MTRPSCEELRDLVYNQKKTTEDIRSNAMVGIWKVMAWMDECGIERRKARAEGYRARMPKDKLEELICENNLTYTEISKEADIPIDFLSKLAKEYQIDYWGIRRSINYEIKKICPVCNEAFTTTKWKQNKHCSRSCNIQTAKRLVPKYSKWSSLERKVHSTLKQLFGEKLKPHFYIRGYGEADFCVPSRNIIVECQGEYWHGLPIAIERDAKKRKFANDNGYTLLELWESDINNGDYVKMINEFVGDFAINTNRGTLEYYLN